MITRFPEKETDDTEADFSRSHSQALLVVVDLEAEAVEAEVSEALVVAEVSAEAVLLVDGKVKIENIIMKPRFFFWVLLF